MTRTPYDDLGLPALTWETLPEPPDAWAAATGRVQRARRRRTAAVTAGLLTAAVAVGVVLPDERPATEQLQPAAPVPPTVAPTTPSPTTGPELGRATLPAIFRSSVGLRPTDPLPAVDVLAAATLHDGLHRSYRFAVPSRPGAPQQWCDAHYHQPRDEGSAGCSPGAPPRQTTVQIDGGSTIDGVSVQDGLAPAVTVTVRVSGPSMSAREFRAFDSGAAWGHTAHFFIEATGTSVEEQFLIVALDADGQELARVLEDIGPPPETPR